MIIVLGLLLIPVAIVIILQLRKFNISRIKIKLLNTFLITLSFVYLIAGLYLTKWTIGNGIQTAIDYIINSVVIFICSPFLWIVLFHYCNQLFKNKRVRKNAKIKSDKHYIYYRDDLDKISPSIIMYTSMMDIDMGKAISAVILKLKLLGFIEENNSRLRITDKNPDGLLESEKLVLTSISQKTFHEKAYRELVKKEALDNKYIKPNNYGKLIKAFVMLLTIVFPVIFTMFSVKLDEYVCENYPLFKGEDGIYYVLAGDDDKPTYQHSDVLNKNDYYHKTIEYNGEKRVVYNYDYIRLDKSESGDLWLNKFLYICVVISILLTFVFYFTSLSKLVDQLRYFNKNYARTAEGNKLLNKAYALKNYLKDYSLMKDRTQDELILWEYYMIYAVVLDVNTKIENDIVKKYLEDMALV